MADYRQSRTSPIPVDTHSPSAEWAQFINRKRHQPVAALEIDGRPSMTFVPSEVLVDAAQRDLVGQLVDRYGAQIVPAAPLPPPPNGMAAARGVDPLAMPMPTRLRFSQPPPLTRIFHGTP